MLDLLQHKAYMMFWGAIAIVFLGVTGCILWKLQQIVDLLRR